MSTQAGSVIATLSAAGGIYLDRKSNRLHGEKKSGLEKFKCLCNTPDTSLIAVFMNAQKHGMQEEFNLGVATTACLPGCLHV